MLQLEIRACNQMAPMLDLYYASVKYFQDAIK